MVLFQTEETKKSLIYSAAIWTILLILLFMIKVEKSIPTQVDFTPEIQTITPDPPIPMPELKDDAGGKSLIPAKAPGKENAGSPKLSDQPKPAIKETSTIKGADGNDSKAADAAKTSESNRPKIRTMGSTNSNTGEGQDDFGDNSHSSSNVTGTNGGVKGNGSPYGAGESKIPGAFNNKLPSEVDFAGAVYVNLKVGVDGIPIEFIAITRATDLNPSLKASIIADIKNKLRNLRCRPHTSEYTEEFKFVYKKS